MKSDSGPLRPIDTIERAHLKEPGDASHTMFRYEPDPALHGLVERFWIPVWSVPPGQEAPQRVLQYPHCLFVITNTYARFYGVVSGLSTTTLTGDGWAVGVMCAPSAGYLITGRSVSEYTDTHVPVADVLGAAGEQLTERVRTVMRSDPTAATAHGEAMAAYTDVLRGSLPVDEEGQLINAVVAFVEQNPDVLRVAQVCAEFDLTERSLQRLVRRRVGLSPKWLIQRRRLQEAAQRLREQPRSLADVAAVLGYADQAHFSRDFTRVTALTPREFAKAWAGVAGPAS
ncbi:AraC family transcriptional regulator [Occultella glacieicola]|uniref:AraC family transcriptional regulator n=1 Tax=Occultella glacieicola TaxID=2518684 RepID=A0ABY2E279_9MICO|nr:helix-turn-helix domain-containing protein [Occultella glacieicola]TDE92697.1 AraC family transcriptional regulator [Occultella glacieicola]